MMFYLTTLNLAGCLTEEAPVVAENETDSQKVIARDHWKNADYLCKNYILNALEDSLYSVYNDMKSAKELWESLDRKYKIEGAGSKKFIVGRFLDFVMLDTKSVTIQFQELQVLINEIKAEGMLLSEAFLVAAIIHKLPETWKEFKSYLIHGFRMVFEADRVTLSKSGMPDIAYSVSRLSRYTSNPGSDHWKAIVRLLRYLRYTRDFGLHYTKFPAVLEGYCDANWISDMKDSKSTSGYVFVLGGAAVSWKSSKQTCIARSTMESEFIALDKDKQQFSGTKQVPMQPCSWILQSVSPRT
ncbi:uncharacterized protein LOC130757890 [Actinidia eriantha]|uniref:uncharacterized protein LOC130757890 n=1 Tax=Actinidia eriantha TaxID=165200 RepID=UPI00258B2B1E|nr:uncharacterized protein LOC130757890 [Actinidia eriantha]